MTVMLVNIVGPDAKLVEAGQPVPASWPADYVKSLVKSGGAGTQKAWDEIVERNRIEAEARAAEPAVPSWPISEQKAAREHATLVAQMNTLKSLGVDVSGVEMPPAPPPPPQVPEAVRAASAALLASPGPKAADKVRAAIQKEYGVSPRDEAVAKARHDLAGTLRRTAGGDGK